MRRKKKKTNITLRDMLEGKGMESASDTNQIVLGLKRDLQRTLNSKRERLDMLRFKLKRKGRKIQTLRTRLKELMVDGEQMGVNEKREKNQKRLEAIRIISNRPIYHSRTDLNNLVKRLEKKQEKNRAVTFRLAQYKHLLETKVRVLARKLSGDQKEQAVRIRNVQKKCNQIKRLNIERKEELGKVVARNKTRKREIENERKLWEHELGKRRDLQNKKKQVQTFYKKMVQKQKQIERSDAFDLDADGERKLEEERAVAIVMEDLARKTFGEVHESALEEETKFKRFFIDCGVDTEASVNTIFKKIADQTRQTNELTSQRDALRLEVQKCRSEIASMTSCITESGFSNPREYSPEITNLEELLSTIHAEMVKKINHYRFLNDIVNSVEIAFSSMNDRYVYGGKKHKSQIRSVSDVKAMTSRLLRRVEQIVFETSEEKDSSSTMSPRSRFKNKNRSSSGDSTATIVQQKIQMHQRSQEFLARHILSQAMINSASKIDCELTDYNIRVDTVDEVETRERDRATKHSLRGGDLDYEDLKKTRQVMKSNLLMKDPEPVRSRASIRKKASLLSHHQNATSRPRASTYRF